MKLVASSQHNIHKYFFCVTKQACYYKPKTSCKKLFQETLQNFQQISPAKNGGLFVAPISHHNLQH